MKNFHCDACHSVVFFENVGCGSCGHELAFVSFTGDMIAIEKLENDLWQRAGHAGEAPQQPSPQYRKCQNYVDHNACNWTVAVGDPNPLCLSCRLTQTIPDLAVPGYREAWVRLETAKRRLIFSLLELQLPVYSKAEDPAGGMVIQFLADQPDATGPEGRVLTGHDDGTIVINIAEADDAERESRRIKMHEPYRTLLGHLRHEIGHYYWDRLIRDSERLEAYRTTFGDEREDYAEALKRHYANGAPAGWQQNFISEYASTHPWEDWAETWAHYLHISDTLETADACGLSLQPARDDEPSLTISPVAASPVARDFDPMIERWLSVAYLLNNLNRGLGLADAYPFVLSAEVITKLRFVHDTLLAAQGSTIPKQSLDPAAASAPCHSAQ